MGMFSGKKGVIMGVANHLSIASGVAQFLKEEGAELAFSHLPDVDERGKMEQRVRKVTDPLGYKIVIPCDVTSDDSITNFFAKIGKEWGKIDFLVHSIAFASVDDIRKPTLMASREGFKQAMDISCYSLIAVSRAASELMTDGGSIVTMSYYGGERVVPGYNMMGVCKSALEMAMRYVAFDLGSKNIRVNAVSAGPIKTLAASAVGDFSKMLGFYAKGSPLGKNVNQNDVAKSTAYLLSDLSTGVTGEVLHVDSGYHVMGIPAGQLD